MTTRNPPQAPGPSSPRGKAGFLRLLASLASDKPLILCIIETRSTTHLEAGGMDYQRGETGYTDRLPFGLDS